MDYRYSAPNSQSAKGAALSENEVNEYDNGNHHRQQLRAPRQGEPWEQWELTSIQKCFQRNKSASAGTIDDWAWRMTEKKLQRHNVSEIARKAQLAPRWHEEYTMRLRYWGQNAR